MRPTRYGTCTLCYHRHAPKPKRDCAVDCVNYVRRLCRLARNGIANLWHTAHRGTIRLLSDRRRRTMCKRAGTHDVARLPSKMQKITDQNRLECDLLRLPLELRLQIYDHVYPQSTMVTIWAEFMHGRYRLVPQDMTGFFHQRWLMDPCIASVPHHVKNALALSLTCREIYVETIPYIYSRTKFCFSDLRLILALPDIIPAKHLQSITSLRLLFDVDKFIDLFDLSRTRFVKKSRHVNDPNPAVTRRRKKYVQLWPYLARNLVNIRSLTVVFRRFQIPDNDRAREGRFCKWLLTQLFQFHDGKSLWSDKLEKFEVRLGRQWESLVPVFDKPFIISGESQVAPFDLRPDRDCVLGWWGCQCSEMKGYLSLTSGYGEKHMRHLQNVASCTAPW